MKFTFIKKLKKPKIFKRIAILLIFLQIVAIFVEIGVKITYTVAKNTLQYTIVLDAGHGGIDGGVVGDNSHIKEADLNLDFVKILGNKLENAGVNVVYTRKTKSALYSLTTKGFKKEDFKRRKEIIDGSNPDAVISIHMNYYKKARTRRGALVLYDNKNENSYPLAKFLQDKLNNEINSKYGGRVSIPLSGDYYIIKCTNAPSVIIECGFLSNSEDEKLLTNSEYQEEFCYQVFSGIMGYLFTKSINA